MVSQDGGRWDVAAKGNTVYLERLSGDDEQIFEALLEPDEARELGALLTKKAEAAANADDSDDEDSKDDEDD